MITQVNYEILIKTSGALFMEARKDDEFVSAYKGEISGESEIDCLEKLFERFNIDHPDDYKNRSLSVGDAVILGGAVWFCQTVGWQKMDDTPLVLLGEKEYRILI